jgi:myo-inositol-1(or 4)-monophosphatase
MNPAAAATFVLELAAVARSETLPRFNSSPAVENKAPEGAFDPVTEADRAAERAMRDLIERSFPDHGIVGEEWPDREGTSGFTWSLDPIDGTRSYICGLPTWTTLIALLDGGIPTAGLIDVPCLGETYLAAGDAVTLIRNDARDSIRTSCCQRVADARFSTTDPYLFAEDPNPLQPILEAVRVSRFGHDAYAYARLAAGSIDLVIEAGLKPHDYNALIPIVRGAGGHFGDWRGGDDFTDGAVIAAASRELYEEAVALLSA